MNYSFLQTQTPEIINIWSYINSRQSPELESLKHNIYIKYGAHNRQSFRWCMYSHIIYIVDHITHQTIEQIKPHQTKPSKMQMVAKALKSTFNPFAIWGDASTKRAQAASLNIVTSSVNPTWQQWQLTQASALAKVLIQLCVFVEDIDSTV